MRKLIISLLGSLCITSFAFAQTKDSIADYYIDFSVPDVGAFTLLGTKPEQTTNPGNVKQFAASLLNVATTGTKKITPGLAIDWAPIQTFGKKAFTIDEYKKNYLLRNLQVTFGTVADSSATNVGFGIKWTFIDRSDPLLDVNYAKQLNFLHDEMFVDNVRRRQEFTEKRDLFLKQIDQSRFGGTATVNIDVHVNQLLDADDKSLRGQDLEKIITDCITAINSILSAKAVPLLTLSEKATLDELALSLKKIDEGEQEYDKKIVEAFKKAKEDWKKNNWNAMVVAFGSGWVWNAPDSKWASLKTQVFKSYLNAKFPLSTNGQFTGIVSYAIPKKDSNNDSTILSQFFIGGRLLRGNADNRFSIDAGYGFYRANSSTYDMKDLNLNIGFEFKVNSGLYLEIVCGVRGKPSRLFESGNILSLGSLKYTLNNKRRFDLP